DLLKREGVIDQPLLFTLSVLALKVRGDLKFGEYEFPQHASLHDVINTLTEGKVVLHTISIPEGLTSEQIVQRLLDSDVLTGTIHEMPVEGALLPDTYKVPRGMARDDLLKLMKQKRERLVQDIWDHRAPGLPFANKDELVTLASIIEKE